MEANAQRVATGQSPVANANASLQGFLYVAAGASPAANAVPGCGAWFAHGGPGRPVARVARGLTLP
jgi:hypothetical protein